MSTAKTHTHQSNRAKVHAHIERKPVFKTVLDSPFHIPWPSVPMNVQNQFLAMAITLVEGMATYRAGRKRKRPRGEGEGEHSKKKRKGATEIEGTVGPQPGNDRSTIAWEKDVAMDLQAVEPPPVLEHLTTGINAVTRALEAQLAAARTPVTITNAPAPAPKDLQPPNDSTPTPQQTSPPPKMKLIFICRADIDPPLLVAHIPPLVAAHNAIAGAEYAIKLIPLPRGAEASLADALGLRRVAVLAVAEGATGLGLFDDLLPSVPTLTAPWRAPAPTLKLAPTRVKQVRTSAPRDLKGAKEERAKGLAAAKLKTKAKTGRKGKGRVVSAAGTVVRDASASST
ncbi:hypothetical protein FIBSPDRAFT_734065 [Athelia psychrophila]|uniref:Uncharacterized protein n=1 Tax=Athelia psychrophila TaxID=1759441 RepID=A0A166NS41_9AGAM|nr:hypothetical protein FIBSPDRAFT_734065 [Fibularhizoctonia sp. CBS 109695]